MRKAVAYKRLKKWKIIKPSPQKVVAVAHEMWQLQGSEWNILVFLIGDPLIYGRWLIYLRAVVDIWRFECIKHLVTSIP